MTDSAKPPLVWCILERCAHRYEKDGKRCKCPCHEPTFDEMVDSLDKLETEAFQK